MSTTQPQTGKPDGTFGQFLWWLFKGVLAIIIAICTFYIYSWNSWISTHYVAGKTNESSGGFFGNIFNSWIHSWSYLGTGQVGSFLLLFLMPPVLVLSFIGLVASLKQKST